MTRLTTCVDAEAVAVRAAEEITRLLNVALEQRSSAHLALSGGTTPARTYELLASSPVEWQRTDVWFADERCVGPDDPESNYRLTAESLLEAAHVPPGQVHRMEGELEPAQGAHRYALELAAHLPADAGTSQPVMDVIVLGIGPDGHVASLFPGSEVLRAVDPPSCIAISDSPKPPPERLTLSLPVLRAARNCLLLATGASKADAVSAMLAEPTEHVPASLLRRERLSVIVDDGALPGGRP